MHRASLSYRTHIALVGLIVLLFNNCNYRDDFNRQPETVRGYKPVYLDSAVFMNSITSVAPRPLSVVGGVYLYKFYMLVVDENTGIHVFDNSDTTVAPVPLCFITVPMVSALSVKNDVLYVQNTIGLVYIDVSNLPNIQVLGIVSNQNNGRSVSPPIPTGNFFFNRSTVTYFECPEPNRGRIIRWELTDLNKPKCNIRNN